MALAISELPIARPMGAPHLMDGRHGEEIALPPGMDLTGAMYQRVGADLLVILSDGTPLLIGGYFANPASPDLLPADGPPVLGALLAFMPAAPAESDVAQAGPSAAGAQAIGRVTTVSGTVTATRLDGSVETLQVGAQIFQGDVLQTGPKAAVAIIFADNATFALDQNARMVVDTYLFAPATGKGTLALSVLNGVFGFASGDIVANTPGAMTIKTPRAIAGVRGSEGGGNAGDDADSFFLNSGEMIVSAFGGSVILSSTNPALRNLMVVVGEQAPPQLTTRTIVDDHSFTRVMELLPEQPGGHKGIVPGTPTPGGDDAAALGQIAPAAGGIDLGTFSGPVLVTLGAIGAGSNPGGGGGLGALLGRAGATLVLPVTAVSTAEPPDAPPGAATPTAPGTLLLIGGDGPDVLTGSVFGDVLIGGGGDDVLDGGAGDDLLIGGEGDDRLLGGEGNDLIIGGHGEGDDEIDGGPGDDTASFASTDAGVAVDLEAGTASGDPDIGTDTIAGVETVIGGSGDDTLIGDAFANRLDGGDGDDVLEGGAGDDVLIGGAGQDVALFNGPASQFLISLVDDTVTDLVGDGGTDRLIGVESTLFKVSESRVREIFLDGTNNAPIGRGDSFVVGTGETLVVDGGFKLLANDVDLEGESLQIIGDLFATKAGGFVQMAPAGSFVYKPPAGFSGVDRFEYVVADSDATRTDRVEVTLVVGDAGAAGFTVVTDDPGAGVGDAAGAT